MIHLYFLNFISKEQHINIYFNQQDTYMPIIGCNMNTYQKNIYKKCKRKTKITIF